MSSLPQPLPPVPVQPIAFSSPIPNRPSLITAIGVASIIIGSLGMLFNGIAGLQALVMVMMSNMSQAAVARQAALDAAATATAAKPADPLSMPADDRQTVLRGLAMHRAITKPRREQLDALLVKCGRQIFKLRGADLTVDVVRQNVTESGRLPDAKGGEGPDFFVIGEGRIELADDHAKFVPGDGRETVRVSASDTGEQPNWQAGLTAAQVKAIVDKIEAQAGHPLPTTQRANLEATFSAPGQGFFTTAPTIPEAAAQVQSVTYYVTNGVGQLTVTTQQGMLTLDGQGNTTSSQTWGGQGGAAFAGPSFKIDRRAGTAAIICAVLGLALSIYLLVIGILMLRQHPRAGRLHKVYAWVKIPLAIVGGFAWVVLWASIAAGSGAITSMSAGIVVGAIVAIIVGCAYPVALLIALRSREAREYYAAVP